MSSSGRIERGVTIARHVLGVPASIQLLRSLQLWLPSVVFMRRTAVESYDTLYSYHVQGNEHDYEDAVGLTPLQSLLHHHLISAILMTFIHAVIGFVQPTEARQASKSARFDIKHAVVLDHLVSCMREAQLFELPIDQTDEDQAFELGPAQQGERERAIVVSAFVHHELVKERPWLPFLQSSEHIHLEDNRVVAECLDINEAYTQSTLDLNPSVGNRSGSLA